jgi:hypothetical protein
MSINTSQGASDVESDLVIDPKPGEAFKRLGDVMSGRYVGWGNSLLVDSWKDSELAEQEAEIKELIQELESDELARALYSACMYGDLLVAQSIWHKRGPFSIEYQAGQNGQVLLNGQLAHGTGDALDTFANTRSIKELRELFEWLPTIGMGFMVGVGSPTALLLQSDKLKSSIRNLAWSTNFSGELPILSESGVARPELMLALQDKLGTSLFPEAFQDVLCWVDERMLVELPNGFEPYKAMQHLKLRKTVYGSHTEYAEIPFAEVTDELLNEVSQRTINEGYVAESRAPWSFDELSLRTVPLDPQNPRNNAVLGHQASETVKHGYDHLPGHVLCRTRVDVLSQFATGPVRAENMAKAAQYVWDYFPVDLMMFDVHQIKPMNTNCLREKIGMVYGLDVRKSQIRDFYNAFGHGSPVQSKLKTLPEPLLKFMFAFHCTSDLDAKSMISLNQGLGIDNTGFSLDLDFRGLQLLHDEGFRFSDLTVISKSSEKLEDGGHYHHRASSQDTSVLLDMSDTGSKGKGDGLDAWNNRFANALNMNLWPVRSTKPESVAKGLSKASRKKSWSSTPDECALLAYLDHAGIEACTSVAKTTAHWVFLKDHFGREAIEPYVRKMPRDARGQVLSDDMGL